MTLLFCKPEFRTNVLGVGAYWHDAGVYRHVWIVFLPCMMLHLCFGPADDTPCPACPGRGEVEAPVEQEASDAAN